MAERKARQNQADELSVLDAAQNTASRTDSSSAVPESADSLEQLRLQLHAVHIMAGEPSSRTIAELAGQGSISHTTVNAVLRSERVLRWQYVEAVVNALGGNVEMFKDLWRAARRQMD